jgi:hypothetical protein
VPISLPSHDPNDPGSLQFILDRLALAAHSGTPVAGRVVSGGKTNNAASRSTTSTTYVTLSPADQVTVTLPTDGLIVVGFQALWQNTVAIFIGANQLKRATGAGVPVIQEANGPAETNDDGTLVTFPFGLETNGGAGAATEVTTGQVISSGSGNGGPVYIFAAAGQYDIAVKFKNNVAGTTTVKSAHLWVWVQAFA